MINKLALLFFIVISILLTVNIVRADLIEQSGTFVNFSFFYFNIPSFLFLVLISATIGLIFHIRSVIIFHCLGALLSFFVVSLIVHILPIGDERAVSFFYYDVLFLSLFYATLLTLVVLIFSVIGRRFEKFRLIQNRINRLNNQTKILMVFAMYLVYITPMIFFASGVFHYSSIHSGAKILFPLFGVTLFLLIILFLIVPLYKKTKNLAPDIPMDDKKDYLFFLSTLLLLITVSFLIITYYPSYPIVGGPRAPTLIEVETPDGRVYSVYDSYFYESMINDKRTYYLEKEIGQDAQGRTIKEKVVVHGDEVRRYEGTDNDLYVGFLYEIGGKLTYGLLEDGKEYIVHGDKKIGSVYDSVSHKNFFDIEDKIVFTAKKDGKEFVVHGEEVVSDEHDLIIRLDEYYNKILYCFTDNAFKEWCIYDGIEYNHIFEGHDSVNDKPIFVAIRDGKYFVVLGNRRISDKYNLIKRNSLEVKGTSTISFIVQNNRDDIGTYIEVDVDLSEVME